MEKQIDVLLVEDNTGDARLIEELVRESSAITVNMALAGTLKDAEASLASGRYDLVLLDLNLPDSSGMDTITRFRACKPDLPVVVLTGMSDPEFAVECMKRGAQDYLVKGTIDAVVLEKTLRFALERHRLRQELQDALVRIKTLRGLIPICSVCKNIRNDQGYWQQVELYVTEHSDADFTHDICPACLKEHYPDEYRHRRSNEKGDRDE